VGRDNSMSYISRAESKCINIVTRCKHRHEIDRCYRCNKDNSKCGYDLKDHVFTYSEQCPKKKFIKAVYEDGYTGEENLNRVAIQLQKELERRVTAFIQLLLKGTKVQIGFDIYRVEPAKRNVHISIDLCGTEKQLSRIYSDLVEGKE
jgi:hypothetical protein